MITYHLESWQDYVNDPMLEELWLEHYGEIAEDKSMPMRPDKAFFAFCAGNGMLQLMTVRKAGVMVGYCIVVVRLHPHYSVLCGFEDSYFLTLAERRGLVGYKLFRNMLASLAARGVKRVFFMTKLRHDVGKLLARLGMTECDRVYTMALAPKES